jgi:nucleotide-binding universal stress UspA family protein
VGNVFTSILCPVDFSPHAERALIYALDLAQLTRAHLTIITAVDPFLEAASSASGHGETLMRQTQGEIHDLLTRISAGRHAPREAPGIAVLTGNAADEILKQIVECGADLVVMGTQGLEGSRRFVFGSTTEKVLRESPVPVLAVPLPAGYDEARSN